MPQFHLWQGEGARWAPLPRSGGAFSSPTPHANLATAGEGTHNADAVRTAKKNESCGEATPWGAEQPVSAPGPAASGAFFLPHRKLWALQALWSAQIMWKICQCGVPETMYGSMSLLHCVWPSSVASFSQAAPSSARSLIRTSS